jgi:hypothetical protein
MKLSKNTKKFISAIAERAIKTFAQTAVATFGADIAGANLDAFKIAAYAALLSVLTSLASAQFGSHGPSLAGETVNNDEVAGH